MVINKMLPATPKLRFRLKGERKVKVMQLQHMEEKEAYVMLTCVLNKICDFFHFEGTPVVIQQSQSQQTE